MMQSDLIVAVGLAVSTVGLLLSGLGGWMGLATSGAMLAVWLTGAFILRDRRIGWFLALWPFAMLAAVPMDAAYVRDGWLVHNPAMGPFVGDSPLYYLMGWGGVVSSVAYVGWRVAEAGRPLVGPMVTGLLGAAVMPVYEGLCTRQGWFAFTAKATTFRVPLIGGHSAYADVVGNLIFYAALGVLVHHVWSHRPADAETPPIRHALWLGLALFWLIFGTYVAIRF